MEKLLLEVTPRDKAHKAKAIRRQGRVPAVFYGPTIDPMLLSMDYQTFRRTFRKAGENTIIELSIDGKTHPVLVHDVQYHPVTDDFSHVDFILVNMDKEVSTSVEIDFVGVSPAVKDLGGVLSIQKHELKIKCLPKDLIHRVEVDLTQLVDFNSAVHVAAIEVPSAITVLDLPDDTVVTVTAKREETEETPTEGESAGAAAGSEEAKPEEKGEE
ncbi:50S ribosomal protein L25 [Candidatus Peregrinibacteria bacterium CG_4_9_14_0_2_um_filter_53_11]|nr:MAG: 50S ribosomal protein L25 [Candidatus Peregrinibacteria bacterium CG_4_9_14_0_2_um_filter_53_11]